MKSLITGITGFVGSHLAEYLLRQNEDVYGIKRWRSPIENIAEISDKIKLYEADLRDLPSLVGVLSEVKPDYIYHLAAQSFVPASFSKPVDTFEINTIGTVNLLEAVKISRINPLIHVCSTSDVYGKIMENEIPILETNPIRPMSPYATSKASEDLIAWQYFESAGLKTIITRAFNITGPRRGEVFAESSFAKQIAQIEEGIREPVIFVGNLDSVRTFADVRDIARAYFLLLHKCVPGEIYNIAGNTTTSIGKLLDILISKSSEAKNIKVKVDKSRLRPVDSISRMPDDSKFRQATGWKPEIKIEKSLEDLLDYWRSRV